MVGLQISRHLTTVDISAVCPDFAETKIGLSDFFLYEVALLLLVEEYSILCSMQSNKQDRSVNKTNSEIGRIINNFTVNRLHTMNALVDYGTSSESSSSDTNDEPESKQDIEETKPVAKLPKPSLDSTSLQTSVFSNPFVAAERAKAAILEKHVKMVPGKEDTQMINGKKICWNHRKGRCRFGHNCKFAHDTDVQKTSEELEAEKQKLKTVVCEGYGTMTSAPPPPSSVLLDPVSSTDDTIWEGGNDKRKKRPGLSQGLVPGQKVLKRYKEQKIKDLRK